MGEWHYTAPRDIVPVRCIVPDRASPLSVLFLAPENCDTVIPEHGTKAST